MIHAKSSMKLLMPRKNDKGIIEAASVADATKMLRADGKFVSSLAQDTEPAF